MQFGANPPRAQPGPWWCGVCVCVWWWVGGGGGGWGGGPGGVGTLLRGNQLENDVPLFVVRCRLEWRLILHACALGAKAFPPDLQNGICLGLRVGTPQTQPSKREDCSSPIQQGALPLPARFPAALLALQSSSAMGLHFTG
jgi:hypothetical protein